MDGFALLAFYFLLGIAVSRLKMLKPGDFHPLAQFVFYVCLPAAILTHIPSPGFSIDIASIILLVSLPIIVVGIAISALYFAGKLSAGSYGAILMASLFGNIVYLGIPISQEYFPGTIDIMSFLIIITNILIFGLVMPAIQIVHGKGLEFGKMAVKMASNPVLVSAAIAVIMLSFGLETSWLANMLSPLASMTVPLSLVAMGMFAAQDMKLSFGKDVWAILLFKHIALPAVTAVCIFILSPGKVLSDLVMISAVMSPAVANFSVVDTLKIERRKEVSSAIIIGILIMLVEVWLLFGFRW